MTECLLADPVMALIVFVALLIWNFFSNTLAAELSWKPKTGFGPFFINETRIAFCTTDHLQVWDIAAKQPAMSVPLSRNYLIGNPLLTADGAFVACVLLDNTAAVWEVASGRKVASLSGHTGRINGMRFSPDDQLLVTISDDATAKVWSRVNWTEIMTLRGHASAIYSLAFSQDGRLLATGGNDQAIKVWSLSERTDVKTFRGPTADVRGLAFSTVGSTLISHSTDGAIRFWDVTSLKDCCPDREKR